jgi:CheY-like chemotaxis protein
MVDPASKTILLVEDDVLIAMGEQIILEKAGYQVILASSGEKAVKAVETTPGIDLILMDIDLGEGIDGTEAAAIILQDRDLPVVFLSSHIEPEIVEKTEKITSYGYIVKNSGDTVLLASIKMAFKLFDAKQIALTQKEALQYQNDLLNGVLDGVSDVIGIQYPDHTIERYNQAGYEWLGLQPGQADSRKCFQLIGRNTPCDVCPTHAALRTKKLEVTGV